MRITSADLSPKHPIGTIPNKSFVDTKTEAEASVRVGVITRVDALHMKADLRILTGGGDRFEVDLTQGMAGPRSFFGGVPEVNSLVLVGYRQKHKNLTEAVILGYLPTGNKGGYRFDPFAPDDPATIDDPALFEKIIGKTVRYKRLRLAPGDIGAMSSRGAELIVSEDFRALNRAGDSFELRDSDRSAVVQALHQIGAAAGVRSFAGPARRSELHLPSDITDAAGNFVEGYNGQDALREQGPGRTGDANKWAGDRLLSVFNDSAEFPPVVYSTGQRAFYPATIPGVSVDEDGSAEAYTEWRLELDHVTDLVQEVLKDTDGVTVRPRRRYIEFVLGTLVGSDAFSSEGLRQYGRVLKPALFDDLSQTTPGRFSLSEVDRSPLGTDVEVNSMASALFLKIDPPRAVNEDSFVLSVQKQGKLLLNIPGSRVENFPREKNVSAEMSLAGAMKLFLGAATPDNTSLYLTTAGGIKADLGHNADTGNAIDVTYHCGVNQVYRGVLNEDGNAYQQEVYGNVALGTTGDIVETVGGSRLSTANGEQRVQGDQVNLNGVNGVTVNAGSLNLLVSGKTQHNYAEKVSETIVTGGLSRDIYAGSYDQTVYAGNTNITTAVGSTSFSNPAGSYTVTVGVGSYTVSVTTGTISMTTAVGAISLSALAGAVSMTAGLAINLTSPIAINLTSAQVLLGGPAAAYGVCRGLPMHPPGSPSLDWITSLPLQGAVGIRSI